MNLRHVFCLVILLNIFGCDTEVNYVPKPRGFPKIEFPQKTYQEFTEGYCDFNFEYPAYARIEQDTLFFDEKPVDPCWFDIYVEQFDCKIHCSYYPISAENSFEKLNADAFKLSQKHVSKAEFVDPKPIQTSNGVSGFIFKLDGPVATPCQFFLTDSTNHFLRGALYFNTQSKPDSLAPLIEFLTEDIEHMVSTFKWNKE